MAGAASASEPQPAARPVLLGSYNIHFGVGQDGAHDLARIAATLAAADIACLQEVTQGWAPLGHADQALALARRLGRHHVFGAGLDLDGDEVGADGRIRHRRRTFGNMVLSRWPIRSSRTLLLPKRSEPSLFDLQRSVTEAVIEAPGEALRVYSVHLSHVSSRQRAPQIEALLAWLADAPRHGAPWDHEHPTLRQLGVGTVSMPASAIVMGDFNACPDDPGYRRMIEAALRDAWTLAGNEPMAGRTFMDGAQPGRRIDHCFLTPDLGARVRRAWIDRGAAGSDHYPLFVELAEA
ncbi:MAG: endonuclease/exonuclease/phosphatase family protein [Alphaproteobacteria bacterium]|nr:endonuclease/exonuclease/phosphatase family protein [Alphaproteobacteria bacterium]